MIIDHAIPGKLEEGLLRKKLQDTSLAINGNIEFGDSQSGPVNIKGLPVQLVTPGVADTEFTITHNLGYIPSGILIFSVDQAAQVYASRRNQWTATQAFFKSNQPNVSLVGFVV